MGYSPRGYKVGAKFSKVQQNWSNLACMYKSIKWYYLKINQNIGRFDRISHACARNKELLRPTPHSQPPPPTHTQNATFWMNSLVMWKQGLEKSGAGRLQGSHRTRKVWATWQPKASGLWEEPWECQACNTQWGKVCGDSAPPSVPRVVQMTSWACQELS